MRVQVGRVSACTRKAATYNGWPNYQTWNVALWLGNDEPLYCAARAAARMHRGGLHGADARRIVRELLPQGTPDVGVLDMSRLTHWPSIARWLRELR